MPKRVRVPTAKPGELKIRWGRAERGDTPDVCYVWGAGVSRSDSHLLHTTFGSQRMRHDFPSMKVVYDPSFLDELEARGYDLTTLQFSIQKKA